MVKANETRLPTLLHQAPHPAPPHTHSPVALLSALPELGFLNGNVLALLEKAVYPNSCYTVRVQTSPGPAKPLAWNVLFFPQTKAIKKKKVRVSTRELIKRLPTAGLKPQLKRGLVEAESPRLSLPSAPGGGRGSSPSVAGLSIGTHDIESPLYLELSLAPISLLLFGKLRA